VNLGDEYTDDFDAAEAACLLANVALLVCRILRQADIDCSDDMALARAAVPVQPIG
jgi:hypothetical protein